MPRGKSMCLLAFRWKSNDATHTRCGLFRVFFPFLERRNRIFFSTCLSPPLFLNRFYSQRCFCFHSSVIVQVCSIFRLDQSGFDCCSTLIFFLLVLTSVASEAKWAPKRFLPNVTQLKCLFCCECWSLLASDVLTELNCVCLAAHRPGYVFPDASTKEDLPDDARCPEPSPEPPPGLDVWPLADKLPCGASSLPLPLRPHVSEGGRSQFNSDDLHFPLLTTLHSSVAQWWSVCRQTGGSRVRSPLPVFGAGISGVGLGGLNL